MARGQFEMKMGADEKEDLETLLLVALGRIKPVAWEEDQLDNFQSLLLECQEWKS